MKQYTFLVLSLLCMALTFVSCQSEDMPVFNEPEEEAWHTCHLNLLVSRTEYDSDGGSTRAVGDSWSDGDIIYLLFTRANGSTVSGNAVYSASKQEWEVNYYGTLVRDAETKVQAYYFDAPGIASSSSVTLNGTTGVYRDLSGTYIYPTGGDLTVSAKLTPVTSRIRFKGTAGTSFSVRGIKSYTSFSISDATLSTGTTAISTTIQSDGYSPYIYGVYANTSEPTLTVISGEYAFTAECSTSTFQVGKSGWMNLPTQTSHNGWITVVVRAVDLGLSVKWADMNVGACNPEDYGDYFAWGETKPKTNYDWNTYFDSVNGSSYDFSKYATGKKTVLDSEDDAATVNWGGSWRMPTRAEQDELRNNCVWTWTTRNGIKGYEVKSKVNGNSIFLPAAGYRSGGSLRDVGSYGHYWSASLDSSSSDDAYYLRFSSSYVYWFHDRRSDGQSVRAVCP